MKKLLAILPLLILCISIFACFDSVKATTEVNGLIRNDTTWTQSGSPYKLIGAVCVLDGATLTIQPGVSVDFSNYYLRVNGTLQAQGTADNKIHMKGSMNTQNYLLQIQFMDCVSWNNQTGKGCILQNIVFDGPAITVQGSGVPVIADSVFFNQVGVIVSATSSEVIVSGNEFRDVCNQGLSIGKSSSATNNLFNKTTTMATAIVAHGNAYAASNVILGFYAGITSDSTGTIENNVVTNCTNHGISSSNVNAKVTHNFVKNNDIGITCRSIVESNTIVGNNIGLVAHEATTIIINNNILDNTENLVVTGSDNIDAANNWWGTTDKQEISRTIKDYYDDFDLGTVTIEPILTKRNTDAPGSDTLEQTLASLDGYSFSFFNYQLKGDILTVTEITAFSLGLTWAIIAGVIVVKRFRK